MAEEIPPGHPGYDGIKSRQEGSERDLPNPSTDHFSLHNLRAGFMADTQENTTGSLISMPSGQFERQSSGGLRDLSVGRDPADHSGRELGATNRVLQSTTSRSSLPTIVASLSTQEDLQRNQGNDLGATIVSKSGRASSGPTPATHRDPARSKSGNLRDAITWRSEPPARGISHISSKKPFVDHTQEMPQHRDIPYRESGKISFPPKAIKPKHVPTTKGSQSGLQRHQTGISRRKFDRSEEQIYTFASSSKPGPNATEAKLELIDIEHVSRGDPQLHVPRPGRQEKKNEKLVLEQHTTLVSRVGKSALVKSLLLKEPSQDALNALRKTEFQRHNIDPKDPDASLRMHLPRGHIPNSAITPTSKFTAEEIQGMKYRDRKRKEAEKIQKGKRRDLRSSGIADGPGSNLKISSSHPKSDGCDAVETTQCRSIDGHAPGSKTDSVTSNSPSFSSTISIPETGVGPVMYDMAGGLPSDALESCHHGLSSTAVKSRASGLLKRVSKK